jgi:excinuclease ABC subunit C
LREFYRFHAPKEIRVAEDFPERFAVADELSRQFNRKVKISVARENDPKILTSRALGRTKYEHEFRQIRRARGFAEIAAELRNIFRLKKTPARLEGFDAAHISASDFTAARAVWKNGEFLGKEYSFWLSDEASELETLRRFIEFRFSSEVKDFPDLVLIDGGRAHLQAALKGLEALKDRSFAVISAVKPRGQHGEIAHFLTEDGERINFEGESEAHRVLQTLRDEAHNLSNDIHRQRREMSHFYELAAVLPSLSEAERRALLKNAGSIKKLLELAAEDLTALFSPKKANAVLLDLQNYRCGNARKIEPLIVALRYTDENGDAQDLRPLATYRTK